MDENTDKGTLLKKITQLENENDELFDAKERLEVVQKGLVAKLKASLEENRELNEDIEDLQEKIAELKEQLAAEAKETDALDAEFAVLEEENARLKKKEAADKKKFDDQLKAHSAELAALRDQQFQLQTAMEAEKKELLERIRALQENVEDLQREKTKLAGYKKDLDEEIRTAMERNEAMLTKMRDFQRVVDQERRDFRAATRKLQGEIEILNSQLQSERDTVLLKTRTNSEQVQEIERLNTQITTLRQEKDTLEREKRAIERENARSLRTIEEKDQDRAELRKKIRQLEEDLTRAKKYS